MPVTVAHLTTVDMSLRFLVLAQLRAVRDLGGRAIGISAPGPWVEELEAEGIEHLPLASSTRSMDPLADLRAARELWRILRREHVDVLHTHNPKPGLYGRVVGRLARVPIVVNTVHGLYATDDDPIGRARRRVRTRGDRLAVLRCRALPEPRGSRADASTAPHPPRASTSATASTSRASIPTRFRRTSSADPCGRNSALQRHRHRSSERRSPRRGEGLPGAVRGVRAASPDRFRPGRGRRHRPAQARLTGAARSSIAHANRGVVFLGHRDDVDRLYAAMDVFVLASRREGFPRAAMEATAMGLPVVATDIRGCREVVDPASPARWCRSATRRRWRRRSGRSTTRARERIARCRRVTRARRAFRRTAGGRDGARDTYREVAPAKVSSSPGCDPSQVL